MNNGHKILLVILFLVIGFAAGRYSVSRPITTPSAPSDFFTVKDGQRQLTFSTFWEAWDTLHSKFNGTLDDKKLFYGAVAGMVQAAGDPYTTFSDPVAAKQLQDTLQGSFSGVGIEIGLKNGLITVIAPLDGSPAKAAGIKEGDVIVAVDKQPLTQDMTVDEVVNRIRGPLGKPVVLTVISKEDNKSKDISITRATIAIQSVKFQMQGDVAIMTISSFDSDTSDKFAAAAQQAVNAHAKGVVLDMRGNPGGYLTAAVDVASQFLPNGQVVVSEKGQENNEYKSHGIALLRNIPVVVLVDGGSASASEIVAGALKDNLQAPIVGVKTFGKGSVQELVQLQDASTVKVTVAKWYTPSGSSINEKGIEPTIPVKAGADDKSDPQLDAAKTELTKLINHTT